MTKDYAKLIKALWELDIFDDSTITNLAVSLDVSQLDIARIIDNALLESKGG